MKNNKEGEQQAPKPEKEFLVPVRGPVFKYVAEGLDPEYVREVHKAREQGNLDEFMQESRIARLAVGISRQWTDPLSPIPENPYLELSQEDTKYIAGVLEKKGSGGAAESRLASEMIRELQDNFGTAKSKADFKKHRARISDFVQKAFKRK